MSLISLTTAEMANLSSTWVDPAHADHLALIAYPTLAAYMTHIEQAHRGVLDIQGSGWDELQLPAIGEQQDELDIEHDDFARAIHYNLRSQALLAPSEVEAQQFLDLDALLFPEGLSVINLSYTQTAGHAQRLAARLRPEHEAALAAIPTRFGNLLEHVRAWMAIALELGKLAHACGHSGSQRRPGPAHARMAWVGMVNTVRTLIQTLNIDDPVVSVILTRIDVAIRVAGRRVPASVLANASARMPASEPAGERDDSRDRPDHVDDEKTLPGMSFSVNDIDDDDDDDPASTQPTRQLVVEPGTIPRVVPVPLTARHHRR